LFRSRQNMTRGNQRDLNRERARKQQEEKKKSQSAAEKEGNKGLTLEQRKARDAEIMRLKQLKKGEGGETSAAAK